MPELKNEAIESASLDKDTLTVQRKVDLNGNEGLRQTIIGATLQTDLQTRYSKKSTAQVPQPGIRFQIAKVIPVIAKLLMPLLHQNLAVLVDLIMGVQIQMNTPYLMAI